MAAQPLQLKNATDREGKHKSVKLMLKYKFCRFSIMIKTMRKCAADEKFIVVRITQEVTFQVFFSVINCATSLLHHIHLQHK
jgi:hypothetical protein